MYFCSMTAVFSKRFIRFNWVTLVLIYLVVIAGSFVRVTGSGMGCPDWPKCFGQYIPPTEASVLPNNYKEIYAEKRVKKVEKFKRFLSAIGLNETVQKLENNKEEILKEEAFNAKKTWTEYVNRLLGALAGLGVFFVAIWILLKYRKRKLILLSVVNVVLLAIQAWFGSIVVATNLVPWTITVHLFLALVIIGLQLLIIRQVSKPTGLPIKTSATLKWLVVVSFLITFAQMFLGTQVREYIDELTKLGFGREDWSEQLGGIFFIHRSFSWLVLVLLAVVYYVNRKTVKSKLLSSAFIILAIELISGVLLAYFDLPGLVQIAHLLFATFIFGILFIASTRVLFNTPKLQLGNS